LGGFRLGCGIILNSLPSCLFNLPTLLGDQSVKRLKSPNGPIEVFLVVRNCNPEVVEFLHEIVVLGG